MPRTRAEQVNSREDIVRFVKELSDVVREDASKFGNTELSRYLEALSGWTDDMDGYFNNRGEAVP